MHFGLIGEIFLKYRWIKLPHGAGSSPRGGTVRYRREKEMESDRLGFSPEQSLPFPRSYLLPPYKENSGLSITGASSWVNLTWFDLMWSKVEKVCCHLCPLSSERKGRRKLGKEVILCLALKGFDVKGSDWALRQKGQSGTVEAVWWEITAMVQERAGKEHCPCTREI